MNSDPSISDASINKLIDILRIVDLDFECLSCNKIKPSFLDDLTKRISRKIRGHSPASSSKKSNTLFFDSFLAYSVPFVLE